jgi:ATP-dependent DNA helicase RecG
MKSKILELVKKQESEILEFKPSLSQIKDIIETISAFSNTKGGSIIIGVNDKRNIIGVDVGKKTIESLANEIKQNTDPQIYPSISVENMDGKNIIVVAVQESKSKPVFAFDRVYKRVGKSNHRVSSDEIRKMALEGKKIYWDEQICEGASLEDIDEGKLKWFLRKAKTERNLDIDPDTPIGDALRRLNLVTNDELTNAAILMFGRNPQNFFLQTEMRCAKFKGTKAVKPFIDMKVIGGTVYKQVEEGEKFVLGNIHKSAWIESGKIERQEKWEYPLDAVREAITNAIAHRDYFPPANTHISIFDDRIEIWNPGKLPEPLKPEDLKRTHKSIPVNPSLANLLFLIKYIEKWGTGTNDIVKWCVDHGLPEPIFREESGGFSVILRKFKTPEELEERGLNERQIKAVEYIKKHWRITNKGYQEINDISRETAKRDLVELVRKNVLRKIGKGRNVYYEFK